MIASSASSCASSRTSLTTTERARLEVSTRNTLERLASGTIFPRLAAFLTQTVSLDEQTTVKFEIW